MTKRDTPADKQQHPERGITKPASTAWQQTLGDCIGTCAWVAGSSIFAEVAEQLHYSTGFDEGSLNVALITLGLALLAPILTRLHGAMINPVGHVALLCAGRGSWGTPLRLAGQLLGAALGASIATNSVPDQHKRKFYMLSGKVQQGVSLERGFICEAGLVLCMTLVSFYLADIKNKNPLLAWFAPHLTTIFVCVVGAGFTGPTLNPYLAFVWNRIYSQQTLKEHVAVFWLGPIAGAVMAALLWRVLVPPPAEKLCTLHARRAVDPSKRSKKSKAAGKAAARALQRAKKQE